MMNPKGKLAHVVRILWFASIFIFPFLVITEEDVEACAGYASGNWGSWTPQGCSIYYGPNPCSGGWSHDRCVVERCECGDGYDTYCSYCISGAYADCSYVYSGCMGNSC